MLTVRVQQSGNQVKLVGATTPIYYEVEGIDLPPLRDHNFAVWHALPLALRNGWDLHVDGPVDEEVLRNANCMAQVWEAWQPQQFRAVSVSASETAGDCNAGERREDVTFYSGGIDSTYMLTRLGRRSARSVALIVHGMDYNPEQDGPFSALMQRTAPLLQSLNYDRVVLRTNASRIASGHHAWGMALAGHGFLFSGLFKRANFAADFTWMQDLVTFPWGLNHVTNRLFRCASFEVVPRCEDATRCEKAGALASDPQALQATSFCKRRDVRPDNCGKCSKCLRTKVMFAAMTGEIPAGVFLDPSFSEREIYAIDLSSTIERVCFVDAYQQARLKGTLSQFPGIEKRFSREVAAISARARISRAVANLILFGPARIFGRRAAAS